MRLSVVVPTFGRTTMKTLVPSIVEQLGPRDQFIVSIDGRVDWLEDWLASDYPKVKVLTAESSVGDFGCTPNDRAHAFTTGEAIWYIGDDDEYPDAVAAIKRKYVRNKVNIFSMMHTGNLLTGSAQAAQVSSQQVVVPNIDHPPKWADSHNGDVLLSDYHWITAMIARIGAPVFHDDVICHLRRQNFGKHF